MPGAIQLLRDVLPSPHLTLRARAGVDAPTSPSLSRLYTRARIAATPTPARARKAPERAKNPFADEPAEMAAVVAAGAATVAAAAAVLALTSPPPPSHDEARSGATVAEADGDAALPVPSRECAVCLSELMPAAEEERLGSDDDEPPAMRALPACGHAFHADCIDRWLLLRPECPLCRRPVPLAGGQEAAARTPPPPAAWARPARIVCGFGDGRVVWTRSPSSRE
ncbi:unnamed protein product [Urochloa decumbens]|uniref:RING-type domain-containing protein n=1 Tax=Urochloa decumbens TaxID=240449 RepID=A0ABC8WU03_9POAL